MAAEPTQTPDASAPLAGAELSRALWSAEHPRHADAVETVARATQPAHAEPAPPTAIGEPELQRAYLDAQHPRHGEAVETMRQRFEAAERAPSSPEAAQDSFRQLQGAGVTPTSLRAAHDVVNRAEQQAPGLKKLLDETGWGNDPGLVKALADYARRPAGASEASYDDAVAVLEAEWGLQARSKVAGGRALLKRVPGLFELVTDSPAGNDVGLIRALANLAERAGTVPGQESAEDAQARIEELMADQKGPYWNASHPKHDETVGEVYRLHGIVAQLGQPARR